jgi:hypothetical protein
LAAFESKHKDTLSQLCSLTKQPEAGPEPSTADLVESITLLAQGKREWLLYYSSAFMALVKSVYDPLTLLPRGLRQYIVSVDMNKYRPT